MNKILTAGMACVSVSATLQQQINAILLSPIFSIARKAGIGAKYPLQFHFGPLTVAVIFGSLGLLVTTVKRKTTP